MSGKITIKNKSGPVAVIDIEGIIGVPEQWQFDEPRERVATYETFRSVVGSLKEVRSPEVIVNIRSTGGNVNDALLIYDALAGLDGRITTRCYGYAASAATVIAQAASAGCREVSANSLYLIHKSVCSAEGNAGELTKTLGLLEQTDRRIASIYADRSGRPIERFVALMCENDGNGRWLSPEETVDLALADRITASERLPVNAAQMIVNLGLPPIPVKQQNNMNISKRWNAILEILGLAGDQVHDAVPSAAKTTSAGTPDMETVENMAAAQAEIAQAHRQEVAALQNRIDALEAQNARLAALPTATKPKEDPSAQEVRRSPNEEAYNSDLRRFL